MPKEKTKKKRKVNKLLNFKLKELSLVLLVSLYIFTIFLFGFSLSFSEDSSKNKLIEVFNRDLVTVKEITKETEINIDSEISEIITSLSNNDLQNTIKLSEQITLKIKDSKRKIKDAKLKIAAEEAEKTRIAEEKRKLEESFKNEKSKITTTSPTKIVTPPANPSNQITHNCTLNELFVVVNVTSNNEYIYKGDPNCKTGELIETRKVATGRQENLWNPGGWWYWGGTPTGKWKIISKETTSGQFGPYFLRLHYMKGGYVDQYALHGTDDPSNIGNHASHGCIRHYNEDIVHLYSILPVGTVVWTEG